jgi:hypothetical protein
MVFLSFAILFCYYIIFDIWSKIGLVQPGSKQLKLDL